MRLARASQLLALAPLTRADVSVWMQHSIGGADADAVRCSHEASDGNPLFVSELLRLPSLTSRGHVATPLPTLRTLIRERPGSLGGLSVATAATRAPADWAGRRGR